MGRTVGINPVKMNGVNTDRYAVDTLRVPVDKLIMIDDNSFAAGSNTTAHLRNSGPIPDVYELSNNMANVRGRLNSGDGNMDQAFEVPVVGIDTSVLSPALILPISNILMIVPGPATTGLTVAAGTPNGTSVIIMDDGTITGKAIHTSLTVDELEDQLIEDSYKHPDAAATNETISAITQANPGVITLGSAWGGAVGDKVYIDGIIAGMTEINDRAYNISNISGADIELEYLDGTAVDTTAFTAYTTGGVVRLSHLSGDTVTNMVRKVAIKEIKGSLPFGAVKSTVLINTGRILREQPSVTHSGDTEIVYENEGIVLVVD